MIADEGVARGRNDRRKPCKQLDRCHHPMLCPTSPEVLDPVRDAAAGKHTESIEGERGTCPIAHEPLATEIIFGRLVAGASTMGPRSFRGRVVVLCAVVLIGTGHVRLIDNVARTAHSLFRPSAPASPRIDRPPTVRARGEEG